MQRQVASPERVHDALCAFLERHVGAPRSADVGPLLGQAAFLCDAAQPEDPKQDQLLHRAFNIALSADATAKLSS